MFHQSQPLERITHLLFWSISETSGWVSYEQCRRKVFITILMFFLRIFAIIILWHILSNSQLAIFSLCWKNKIRYYMRKIIFSFLFYAYYLHTVLCQRWREVKENLFILTRHLNLDVSLCASKLHNSDLTSSQIQPALRYRVAVPLRPS